MDNPMQATPDLGDELLRWPHLSLLLSSVAVGVAYLLYLFGLAPTLIGVVPRSQLTILLGQLSVTLFGAYLVVVFVAQPPATPPSSQRSTTNTDAGRGAAQHTDDAEQRHEGSIVGDASSDTAGVNAGKATTHRTAMTQFTQALDEHLGTLCTWYVAASPTTTTEPPASYDALFDGDCIETIRRLDFAAPHTGGPPNGTWVAWSATRLTEFRRETMAIIDMHAESIDPTVVAALHNLANSRLTKRVITAEEATLPEHLPADTTLLLFGAADDDPLQTHIEVLGEMVAIHETHSATSLTPIDERECWRGDAAKSGVARAEPDGDAEQYYKLF